MWYEDVTEEDIEVLNKMFNESLDSLLKTREDHDLFRDKRDFLDFVMGKGKIDRGVLLGPFEEAPLYINNGIMDKIYAKWRLRIGK